MVKRLPWKKKAQRKTTSISAPSSGEGTGLRSIVVCRYLEKAVSKKDKPRTNVATSKKTAAKATTKKKAVAKKTSAVATKKTSAKKVAAKKTAAKKVAAKKTAAKATAPTSKKVAAKTTAKTKATTAAAKPAAKKAVAKKSTAKVAASKASATKSKSDTKTAKKTAAKATPAKKATTKKAVAKKATGKAKAADNKQTKGSEVIKPSVRAEAAITPMVDTQSTVVPYERDKSDHYMTDEQLEHFRKKLLDWKQQLMEEVDRTVDHMKDDATNFPDPNDRATQEEEFSLELRTRDRERKLIKKINEAIKRIDDDEYGYCETCGIEIGNNRLDARPTAELCIDCKTLEEIRERQIA